jgi:hypothetical protein
MYRLRLASTQRAVRVLPAIMAVLLFAAQLGTIGHWASHGPAHGAKACAFCIGGDKPVAVLLSPRAEIPSIVPFASYRPTSVDSPIVTHRRPPPARAPPALS